MSTTRTRVFVSFDYDRDRSLKNFLIGQSRLPNSPFLVADWSIKRAAPNSRWIAEARDRISRADVLLVLAGPQTYRSPGVRTEVAIARNLGVPVVQLIGRRDVRCPPVPNGGRRYRWTWDNLESMLNGG